MNLERTCRECGYEILKKSGNTMYEGKKFCKCKRTVIDKAELVSVSQNEEGKFEASLLIKESHLVKKGMSEIKIKVYRPFLGDMIAGRRMPCDCENPLPPEYKFVEMFPDPFNKDVLLFIYEKEDDVEGTGKEIEEYTPVFNDLTGRIKKKEE